MAENVTIYRNVNDPVVTKEYRCRSCMSSMGDFRLYEGSSPNKRHLRGRLVQTCENGACHRTIYHSSDAYLYDDGQHLIARLNAREIQREHLLDAAVQHAPLRVQPPPPPIPTQSGPCPGDCRYASGGKPPGSRQCIEHKCKSCCAKARVDAESKHMIRDRCKIHSVSSFTPNPPANAPQPPIPVAHLTAIPAVTSPFSRRTLQPAAGPSQLPQTPPRQILRSPSTPARSTSTASPIPQIPTQAAASQRTCLANPISATWKEARDQAVQKTVVVQDVISRRSEIKEEEKKTVNLWIWYKPNMPVTRLPIVVDTYPDLRLSAIPLLVREYRLDNNSLFDYWNGSAFDTITPNSIIAVDKGHPVLLRHRPSLINGLDYDNCPGLKDAVLSQSKGATRKRLAEDDLVSPLKKAVKERAGSSLRESIVLDDSVEVKPLTMPGEPSSSRHVLQAPTPSTVIRDRLDLPELHPESIKQISIARWVSGWKTILQAIDDDCDATEASEYPRVFQLPYVKSTVCDYKKKFRESPQELINKFVQYGDTHRGSWQRFSRAKFRQDKAAHQGIVAAVPPSFTPDSTSLHAGSPDPVKAEESLALNITASDLAVVPVPEVSTSHRIPQPLRLPSPIPEDTPEDVALDAALAKHRPLFERVIAAIEDENTCHQDGGTNTTNLCPFCDEILPDNPSASLVKLRLRLDHLSQPDPTPENPRHRQCLGGFTQHINFCSQHRVEKEDTPIAIREGWPLNPDFSTLYDRVCRNYLFIAKVSECNDNRFLQSAKDYYSEGIGNYQQSILGQYQSLRFMNSGAGYYGNPGSQIIQVAIRHLVPQTSVNLLDIHPVKYNDFIRDVLLPEATVRLIETDLDISYIDAIHTFEKSCRFGNHMHSADAPEHEVHIRNALRRASTGKYYGYDTYRKWIASDSPLDIEHWIKENPTRPRTDAIPEQSQPTPDKGKHRMTQTDCSPEPQLTPGKLYMKQEEMDEYLNDPFADVDEDEDTSTVLGGIQNPIVID